MKKYKGPIILLNLVLLLIYFNYSISKKEQLLKEGKLILLELAPIDPRSLMQGDYMTLRYNISENINPDSLPRRGYCIVQLDSNRVASKIRFQKSISPLNEGDHAIKYTIPDDWNVNIGAESYFFQEGHAERYDAAKYGGVKVDKNGNSLLIGLYDNKQRKIE